MADNKDKKVLNVPALRFPEFTDEWQHILNKELFNPVSDKNKDKIITLILSASQTEGMIERNNIGIDIKFDENSVKNYKIVRTGDYVVHLRSFQGGFAFSELTGICSPAYTILRPNKQLQYGFLRTYFMSKKFIDSLRLVTYGIRDGKSISVEEWMQLYTNIPSDKEQDKIIKLFNILDERIKLQNKIIEDLKKLKSAIVEMLLCNQSGESFKLGDVGCYVRGLTYANEDVTENKAATIVIRANNLNYGSHVDKREVVYVNKTPTVSQILRKGDIVICMANGSSTLVGKNSYYPFNDRQSTIGAFCGIYRTSNPLVKWLMQSQRYKRQVYQSLQGGNGAIANLNGDDILNMSFPLIEKEKSQSIIFTIEAIEKSLVANKYIHRLYYTQKSYLLKQMFI